MNEKAKYTQKAPVKSNVKARAALFVLLTVGIIVLLVIANLLPYSGITTLAIFALGAVMIHKLLSDSVFDITYALFDDRLVFIRKYGRLEWECEVFPFDEAKFYRDKIEHRGKAYDFCPDDKLVEYLGI